MTFQVKKKNLRNLIKESPKLNAIGTYSKLQKLEFKFSFGTRGKLQSQVFWNLQQVY